MNRTYHIAYYQSKSNPDKEYEIIANLDQSGQAYLSCNCPSWTRGAQQTGKAPYERTCKHCEAAWNEYKMPIIATNTEFYSAEKRLLVYKDFVWYRNGRNYSSRELLDTVLGLKRKNETEEEKKQSLLRSLKEYEARQAISQAAQSELQKRQQKNKLPSPPKKKSDIESLSDALEFD